MGKSLELEHPQYFVDGRGSLQAKKGHINFSTIIHFRTYIMDIIHSRSLKIFMVFWPVFSVVPILNSSRVM